MSGVRAGLRWPRPAPAIASLSLLLALFLAACEGRREVQVTLDGETLAGTYWEPGRHLAPAVLLIPSGGESREDWAPLAARLNGRGFAVLAIDVRGGEAASEETRLVDIVAGFSFLRDQMKVDAARLGIVAAAASAPDALRFAATEPSIRALVLVSPPASDGEGLAGQAMGYYGWRPVLLAAGREAGEAQQAQELAARAPDSGAHGASVVKLYDSAARGAGLVRGSGKGELERAIGEFFETHLAAPVLDTRGGGD